MTARLMVVCFLVGWWGLVPAPLFSQVVPVPAGTITGAVLDPNRDPLPRATAYLIDSAGVDVAFPSCPPRDCEMALHTF